MSILCATKKLRGAGLLWQGFAMAVVLAVLLAPSRTESARIPGIDLHRPLYLPNEVLVAFRPDTPAAVRSSMLKDMGFSAFQMAGRHGTVARVRLNKYTTVEQAVAELSALPGIEFVQPNYRYYPTKVPNDPSFPQQWGFKNSGQSVSGGTYSGNNPGTAGADMDLEPAWDHVTDCSTVVVAVVDTGVNYTHQDLAGNMWINPIEAAGTATVDDDGNGYEDDIRGWDFIDNDNDPLPTDGADHGTHVAGTIGAQGNNGIAGTGVCWTARIMPVRSLSNSGGDSLSVASGIEYAVDNGAQVINLSLGGPFPDPLINNALNKALAQGVVVVAAAGNDSSNNDVTPVSPCSNTQPNIICVAALDQAYQLASFSNRGATSVDVGAPGTNVLSTWAGTNIVVDPATGWTLNNGTNGGWAMVASCGFAGNLPALVNPTTWCIDAVAQYADSADNRAYRAVDLSLGGTTLGAGLTFYVAHEIQAGDGIQVGIDPGPGTNPFDGVDDVLLDTISGSSGNLFVPKSFDLGTCLSPTCGIGFRFFSDGAGTDLGAAMVLMNVATAQNNTALTGVINGTSMATPHVAGLVALLRAHNPGYTYEHIIEAIEGGGELLTSLSAITRTGKAVNAWNSLRYITKPRGLSATVTLN